MNQRPERLSRPREEVIKQKKFKISELTLKKRWSFLCTLVTCTFNLFTSKCFLISLLSSLFTCLLFRNVLSNFYVFISFPNFLPLLISNFIELWLESILCTVAVLKSTETCFIVYLGECSM